MTAKDLEAIREKLELASRQKTLIALAKAQAEIQTIQREADAYWDGVYDAIRAVKDLLPEPDQSSGGADHADPD